MKLSKRILSLVLVLAMALSWVYFAPTEADAAAADYIATTYAANLSVKTNRAVSLMTEPYASGTAKYTVPASTMLTVRALHKNTAGAYFYEVFFYNTTLYVDATATTMVSHLTGDVTVTDPAAPASLTYGTGYYIGGKITSTYNQIGTVTVGMYVNGDLHRVPALQASETVNGKSYTLDSSTIDASLPFNALESGLYTYAVNVEAVSYYIDSSGALATSSQTVIAINQPCTVNINAPASSRVAWGIDVSVWNGDVDWAKVKASGIDYAILRIGFEYTLDNRFLEYVEGCEANDIPWGVYLYSYAESQSEALGEANFIINTLRSYNLEPDLPIWFDFEDECQVYLSNSLMNTIVQTFCDTIRAADYEVGLYTYIWLLNSAFNTSYYDGMPIWIAQPDTGYSYAQYSGGIWQWQYSWKGSYSGLPSATDMNYYYGPVPGFTSDTSYLSQCTYYPSNLEATVSATVNMRQYPSTAYSLLASLSPGTKVHVTGLYKNTTGNLWYELEVDGQTGYSDASYFTVDKFLYDDLSVVDPGMADDLDVGAGYYLSGMMEAKYNTIHKANAKIYAGEDTLAAPTLSSSHTIDTKEYRIRYNGMCDGLNFSLLAAGYYTYELSADVKNYYVSGDTLSYQSENVVVWTKPFTVGGAAITPPASMVCVHNSVTDAAVAAGCTTTGLTAGSHCSKCGVVLTEQTVIPAAGHNYQCTTTPATCNQYEIYNIKCSRCDHSYTLNAGELTTQWIDTIPAGMDTSLFNTKTEYRYSDYQTATSYAETLAGYTLKSSTWEKSGTGTVNYVKTWDGFYTGNSLYTQYNNAAKKVTAAETDTTRTVVDSDSLTGYLYYHWCYTDSYYSQQYKTGSYTTFHAYYSTTAPDNYTCDSSDMSYKTSHSGCSNSLWYWPLEVYTQTYTNYKKLFTHERWTDWSDWSTTAIAGSATRKVESRTVYQLKSASKGSHTWFNGKCTACGATCTHTWQNGRCSICSLTCSHTWQSGKCTTCGLTCAHKWSNGKCVTCGTVCAHSWKNGVCSVCSLTCSHSWNNGQCATCGTVCVHKWNEGKCATCALVCNHSYLDGVCTTCGMREPARDYYLFGFINGADYACEGDYANMGIYKFADGKLTTTFDQDSYVGVKASNNLDWYMTDGWLGYEVTSATLYHTSTLGTADKLFVPGGVEVTFTLVDNGDNTFCLSYEITQPAVQPTIQAKYPNLLFEDEVRIDVFFTVADQGSLTMADMGLITWYSARPNGTVADAEYITYGASLDEATGLYTLRTDGIPAKQIGDTIYFKIFLKLADGSYLYSKLLSYSPRTYASNTLSNPDANPALKALVVAMLNYGSAAQEYFSYKPYNLANSGLSDEQKGLVTAYSSGMVSGVVKADSSKAGIFQNTGGFSRKYPSVTFEGAFCIDYFFTPSNVPSGSLKLYYWTQEDYEKAATLSPGNASGFVYMVNDGTGQYSGSVTDIAAKDLDSTIYVAAGYGSGGISYCTGVLAYSIGSYCVTHAAAASDMQAFAAATAVYGYYAERFFG